MEGKMYPLPNSLCKKLGKRSNAAPNKNDQGFQERFFAPGFLFFNAMWNVEAAGLHYRTARPEEAAALPVHDDCQHSRIMGKPHSLSPLLVFR